MWPIVITDLPVLTQEKNTLLEQKGIYADMKQIMDLRNAIDLSAVQY